MHDIHENTLEPEALVLSLGKALTKQHTVAAVYMLDYTFFLMRSVAKLSRTLQTEQL